jgi:Flp pilus assembly pilin Flp
MELLKRLIVEEEGQGLVEYTLILGLVVAAIVSAMILAGVPSRMNVLWTRVSSAINLGG